MACLCNRLDEEGSGFSLQEYLVFGIEKKTGLVALLLILGSIKGMQIMLNRFCIGFLRFRHIFYLMTFPL